MQANPHTGDVTLSIAGEKITLRYDWKALSQIYAKFGDHALDNLMARGPEVVAQIFEIGASEADRVRGVNASWLIEQSPPLVPVVKAIDQALTCAFFGPEGAPENSAEGLQESGEKKT